MATIELSISIYLQAWTTTLQGSPRSRYGAFLGGYAGLQVGYLLAFGAGLLNAYMYAHPQASRRLHKWMFAGLMK
jgi:ATP-binding cassette subfamily C (CFTR/MRP) protein 1